MEPWSCPCGKGWGRLGVGKWLPNGHQMVTKWLPNGYQIYQKKEYVISSMKGILILGFGVCFDPDPHGQDDDVGGREPGGVCAKQRRVERSRHQGHVHRGGPAGAEGEEDEGHPCGLQKGEDSLQEEGGGARGTLHVNIICAYREVVGAEGIDV